MTRRKMSKPQNKTKLTKTSIIGLFIMVLLTLLITGAVYYQQHNETPPPPAPTPALVKQTVAPPVTPHYVGAVACQQCHSQEFVAWKNSHHAQAMQQANEQTVLGNFNNAKFQNHSVESTFFKRDGKIFVNTDGADGKLADFEIKYTFGVTPLQQYLIEFPNGRYQALSIAWDSRTKTDGGQRWFHLYPKEKIAHTDAMHWTGRYQNWNMQCAECHSTNFKKGYDVSTDSYKTTFKELNVACEACHGAASKHIDWAKQPNASDNKGFAVKLKSDWQSAWTKTTTTAQRAQPADDALMNTCWACHVRRSTLVEGSAPSLPLEDAYCPALLTQPAYYADGQQHDEDYTWGSFRQSKMYQHGVTCMDCHEPHSLKLRAEGNAVCTRCHQAAEFDTPKHHHHKTDSKGAECMNCHAPEQNYMIVDGRHDHSFRLPRPDLSETLGSPNACTQCHDKQKTAWAANTLDKWHGKTWRQRPHYGTALHAGVTQGLKAVPSLLALAQDTNIPAVVRATATTLVEPSMRPEFLPQAVALLQDSDASVRLATLGLLEPFEPSVRAQLAAPLLSDEVLGVRIEAARLLADVPVNLIPPNQQSALQTALQAYRDSLQINADWASETINLGNLALRQGDIENAIVAYKRALKLDDHFAPAYVSLADVYRQQGWDLEGEKVLREGLVLLPNAADLHHALGLLLVRKADNSNALKSLEKAAQLAPNNAHYGYVYGVALHSMGKSQDALAVLHTADKHNPYNLEILSALVSIQRETGNNKAALVSARKAAEALPNDAAIKQLVQTLESL